MLHLGALAGVTESYYVSGTNGDNDHLGTQGEPWLTVQYGIDQLQAGDTLYIMAGAYNEKVVVNVSGAPGSAITIRDFGDGEVILDGTGLGGQVSILEIYDQSHLVIEGLSIAHNEMIDAQGIVVEGACSNISILGNKIFDIHFSSNANDPVDETTNAQPLIVYGSHPTVAISNLVIAGNEISNCRTGFSEALAVNGNVDGFEISGNSVHDITNIGIDVIGHEGTSSNPATDQARNGVVRDNVVADCVSSYATSAGIYVDGGKSIVIERNISHHNGYGIEVGCENVGKSADLIEVRDNLLYDNEIAGLAFGGYDFPSGSGKVTNSSATNNTLFANDFSDSFTGELFLTYSENCTLRGNVFHTSNQNVAAYSELAALNLDMDYNLYFAPGGSAAMTFDWNGSEYVGFDDYQSGTGLDANSIFADPIFTSAALPIPDLHLEPESPAVDRGDPAFIAAAGETDIDGEPRVLGGRVDIGADELSGALIFADGFESGDILGWSGGSMAQGPTRDRR